MPRESYESSREKKEHIPVTKNHDFVPGFLQKSRKRLPCVSSEMSMSHIVLAPEKLKSGNRYDQKPIWRQCPMKRLKKCMVIFDMLNHIKKPYTCIAAGECLFFRGIGGFISTSSSESTSGRIRLECIYLGAETPEFGTHTAVSGAKIENRADHGLHVSPGKESTY